jgi:hypothetical protein
MTFQEPLKINPDERQISAEEFLGTARSRYIAADDPTTHPPSVQRLGHKVFDWVVPSLITAVGYFAMWEMWALWCRS